MLNSFRIKWLAVLCGICGGAAPAAAGGFAAARFGGELGHPTTSHPTAIYFNPAGLALGAGTRVYVEGVLVSRSASYDRPVGAIDRVLEEGQLGAGTPADAVGANSGEASLHDFIASPFVAVVSDLGVRNLGVALGMYVPFGGQASWDQADEWAGNTRYPGAVDGPQRWATIDGSIRELYVTAAGAYTFPGPRISVGLGLNLIREEISTVRARGATGTDDLVAGNNIIEGRSYIDASGTTFGIGAGVIWQPIDALHLGISYQSQPGFGETRQGGTLRNKFGNGPESESEIELVQSLPDVFRLGASYRATPELELRVSGDYTRWSLTEYQCLVDANDPDAACAFDDDFGLDTAAGGAGVIVNIPRAWKDTFGVRGGASYWFQPALEGIVGVAYDSNAVPDETLEASIIDMDKLLGTLGVRWTRGAVSVMASLTHVFYFEREVAPRPRDDMGQPVTFDPISRTPDGAGTYNQSITLLNLGVQYGF